jgi:hypothetical protein
MTNILGLAVFALGIVLLIFGFDGSHSLDADVTAMLGGNSAARAIWLVAFGMLSVLAGLSVAIRGLRR